MSRRDQSSTLISRGLKFFESSVEDKVIRTVICHFFNEEYLLPWWLKHHLSLFDHGVMIDHGSTDSSPEIVRELAPHWRLVRSRLTYFNAYLTDFEVMGFELELPGWKMALNVTEFLMPTVPLETIERELLNRGRAGCAASGILIVDDKPQILPTINQSLPVQKHWGIDDNANLSLEGRVARGLPPEPFRNRFYHCSDVGMYYPGRHRSFHPDSLYRLLDLMVFYFGHAPWNENLLLRKTQIATKIDPQDLNRGWGDHHHIKKNELQKNFKLIASSAIDLRTHPYASKAITMAGERYS